ncbi:DNA-primase RepB domain-containing protein [Gilvimarinus chinensis]|uniref:DNA-primase RepB domain-containing protein n=1 Tax=Gilvimarinus chinensis TaxID=396005 RepID=UPI00039C7B1A|nr:DNA-primase RepB domain-containing protein [Gilvimarinus chinensis]
MAGKIDRTLIAVRRQLEAMNAPLYEVGLYDRANDRMLPRTWTAEQVLKSISWLKSMNIKGNDIFIRPAGSMGLVFFDDVGQGTVDRMKKAGLAPAVLIESSPSNYHGWLRVSDSPIDEALATAACKVVAADYGGDVDSADWRHFGRLAGFTTRKPEHVQPDGKRPFVLLSESSRGLALGSIRLLDSAAVELDKRRREAEERRKAAANRSPNTSGVPAADIYQASLQRLSERYGSSMDCSRVDWMIVNDLISRGYSRDAIEAAMFEFSPALASRKSHENNYIQTTLDKAFGV